MAAPFVGREAELALLDAVCIRATREGRPAAALLTGPPGAGKTRLLSELRGRQKACVQLNIVGYQTGTQAPLAAAGEMLRVLVKVPGVGARLEAALYGSTPADDRPIEPLRVFEAAHRSLLALPGTVLLMVDDIHWVDQLSIALCAYLVRSADAEGKGVALIAASRPASVGTGLFDSITRGLIDRSTTLVLGPLERDDGVRLVHQLAPHHGAEHAAELWSLAQGSPFWLSVLAGSEGVSDLDDYLLAQERTLARDASRMLGLLAVAARPLSPTDLAELLTWDDGRTEHAIAEVERSGLLVVEGISVRPAHDLIRSSAEARLPRDYRRELHGLLGGWLEQHAGDDVQILLEALVHRRKAGLEVNDLALRVVRSPRRRLIGREGLRDLSQVTDSGGFSGPIAATLHDRVAMLASELGEHRAAMERWMELATQVHEPAFAARCYLAASRAALQIVERREEALPLLARARAKAQAQATTDPVAELEIAAHQANLLRVLEHRMDEARQVAEQAVRDARGRWSHRSPDEISAREREAWVMALQAAFDAAVIEDDAAEMLRISEEIAQVARDSQEARLSASLNASLALWFLGRTGEALAAARRAWLESHERVLPMLILAAGSMLASRLIELGGLSEAEEVISECVELERRIGGSTGRLAIGKVATRSIHELRHVIWFSRGDWRDAVRSVEQEVALQPDPHYRIHLHGIAMIWLARSAGATKSADIDRHLLAARADAVAADCRRCARELNLRVAETCARLGRVDQAENALRAWDSDGRPAEPGDQLWRKHAGALITIASQDPATGIAELETVVSERRRRGLVASLLWARLDLATALSGRDDGRAADELRQAGMEASTAGAETEQRLAEAGLRRLGVHTWRRGRASSGDAALDKLSDRERQIAILVAAGYSNPEIATRLFLSRKTIERHVSNVLARIGARNRTELAGHVSNSTLVNAVPDKDLRQH